MKRILLLGVGRSTHTLIKYLDSYSSKLNIEIVLADQKTNDFIKPYLLKDRFTFVHFDVNHTVLRKELISGVDLVISMLPPIFHYLVAKDCVHYAKNLITASYVSNEIEKLDDAAKKAGIIILNEIGLDPGIDHVSAMDMIDKLKQKGAIIKVFKSFCGGLIAPDYDDNPWNYKFTWNPKNVVLAGQSGATYLKKSKIKSYPYKDVFSNLEKVMIPDYGEFESYANRNSLHYQKKYNLSNTDTIVRGTLRKVGFSKAWNVFVQLGMTSDDPNEPIVNSEKFNKYLKSIDDNDILEKMAYLDLFSEKNIEIKYNSNADYLISILKQKWSLSPNDKDMIVMQHKFEYILDDQLRDIKLSMVVKGDDNVQTAMAKTVGLPVFFACKLLLENKVSLKGVRIPIYKEIYSPILTQLSKEGIDFFTS